MSNSVLKVKKDPKKVLLEKENKARTDKMIKNSESKDVVPLNWDDHIKAGHKIKSFASIVNNQMYVTEANPGMQLIPFSEYCGSYQLNWIINWSVADKREVWRKNVLYVDLVEWDISQPKN